MASLAPAEKAPSGQPLKVGSPHDPAEREADRIADLLTAPEEPAMPVCAACAAGGTPCAACGGGGDGGLLRRQMVDGGVGGSGGEMVAPASVHRVLSEPGAPLPAGIRGKFERRLGVDLGNVKLNTTTGAQSAAESIGASAFVFGSRIAFANGAYRPASVDGLRLLGHELAHTLQPGADRILRRNGPPPGHPQQPTAAALISSFTSWGDLDEEGLGRRLFELVWMSSDHCGFVVQVMDELGWSDRDDVASAFVRNARDENLDDLARSEAGRAMLRRLKNELLSGFPAGHEVSEALRLDQAIRRWEGATEGATRAGDVLTAAEQRGRTERLHIVTPASLSPAEIDDRLRLVSLILGRMREANADDAEVLSAVAYVEGQIASRRPALTSLAIDPSQAASRVALAQEAAERGSRSLASLGMLLKSYRTRSDLGAARPGYVAQAERVRGNWLAAFRAALDDDALDKLSVAEASATALPRALTEIDLTMLANRSQTEGSAGEMVAWARWIRDRLSPLEADARALAAARDSGAADLAERQAAFQRKTQLMQDSIAAVNEWERAIRAYEALVLGGNLIEGAKDDFRAIRERCRAMRDAAMADNAADLHARLQRHQSDPAIERFYRAIPMFIGGSAMLFGLSVTLLAAMASAGVGALVAGPEATGAVAAGSIALEALTFTTVSRTLSGAMAPPSRTPFLVDLALNIGLFGLLRVMGTGIRTALATRGLEAATGVATHTASYVVLNGWGALQFRLEEGRWPTGDEIAKMSVDSLIMLAGIAVASGSVVRTIRSQQQMRALETFHARYGARLALIEIGRTRLTNRARTSLAAGQGDNSVLAAELRAEAEDLNNRLRALVDEAKADTSIGMAELRTALADRAIDTAAVGGDLLARTLDLPERVGLRRAGGVNLYSYDMGATQPLVDRLAALGATVTQSVDASGRSTVSAEFRGEQPMLFVERAVSGGRYGTMGWPEDFTPATLNRMRLALLANANDVARIAAVMRGFGEPLTPEMLQLIKRYNFDSPGLAFSRDNYEAWMRLAAGQGTVSDARYLIHEAREISAFQRAGFDFNPDAWASMGRHIRTRWHRAFDTAYLNAHAEALAAEFDFVVTQVARATDGRVVLTREVAAAIDGTFSGEDARTYMRVDGYVLQDHPNFYTWSARAGETVELDAVTRTRLGSAIYQGLLPARIGGSTRAAAVRDGAAPTLRELLAIVKAMRM